jgi:hypothetical protein
MARRFAVAGCVIAYGPDGTSTIERNGVLVANVLGGSNLLNFRSSGPQNSIL